MDQTIETLTRDTKGTRWPDTLYPRPFSTVSISTAIGPHPIILTLCSGTIP